MTAKEDLYEVRVTKATEIQTLVMTGGQIHEQYGEHPDVPDHDKGLFLVLVDTGTGRVQVITGHEREVRNLGRRFDQTARAV